MEKNVPHYHPHVDMVDVGSIATPFRAYPTLVVVLAVVPGARRPQRSRYLVIIAVIPSSSPRWVVGCSAHRMSELA